jgi:hypothetical protein
MRLKRPVVIALLVSMATAVVAAVGLAVALALVGVPSSVEAQPSPCTVGVDCPNEMLAETVATPVQVGQTVDIDVSITWASTAYRGYGAEITYDNTILMFVPVGDLNVVYTGLGGMTLDAAATDAPGGDGNITSMGSAKASGTTAATGVAVTAQYLCIAPGTTSLRLIPPPGGMYGSTTFGVAGTVITTGLTAGTITCQLPTPTPTPTPTPVSKVQHPNTKFFGVFACAWWYDIDNPAPPPPKLLVPNLDCRNLDTALDRWAGWAAARKTVLDDGGAGGPTGDPGDDGTEANIIAALNNLKPGGGAPDKPVAGDELVFHFSGHGVCASTPEGDIDPGTPGVQLDPNNTHDGDEPDGSDEALVDDAGNLISDDELRDYLSGFPRSVTITVIIDACHAEGFADGTADLLDIRDNTGGELDPGHIEVLLSAQINELSWGHGQDNNGDTTPDASTSDFTNEIVGCLAADPTAVPPNSKTVADNRFGNADGQTTSYELFDCAGLTTVQTTIAHGHARQHTTYAEKAGPGTALWATYQSNDVCTPASDLHMTFSLMPPGSALTTASVSRNPPGCPAPTVTVVGNAVDIDWGAAACVPSNEVVGVSVAGTFVGTHKSSHYWTTKGAEGTPTVIPTHTPTITPTPTVTPTPTNTPMPPACIDRLGDTQCDEPAIDPDDDGCSVTEEAALGSVFDGTAAGWYDVYDVPVPAKCDQATGCPAGSQVGTNGTRNKIVNMSDVLAVLFYVFTTDGGGFNANMVDYDSIKGVDMDGDTDDDAPYSHGIEEGLKYDRSAGLGPDGGKDPAGPPNGVINMVDVLAALAQAFQVNCSGPG